MSGNRKHGFRRGNKGGLKPDPWTCDGCHRRRPGVEDRNVTLDRRTLCDRCYNHELETRSR